MKMASRKREAIFALFEDDFVIILFPAAKHESLAKRRRIKARCDVGDLLIVHGEEEAKKAEASAKALFAGGAQGGDVPTSEIADTDLVDGKLDILSLLVKSGLCASKSEARRNVQQGGVTVEDQKVTDIAASYDADTLRKGIILRRGKKNFNKVILK